MDSKKKLGEWCCGVNFLKINEKEFKENKDFLKEYFSNCLITTNGKFGATLNYKEKFSIEYSLEVRDLSGAGDTFLAALVSNFIKTKNIRKSIIFANRCASWVVTQKGVVPIDLTKI
jgi:sugar/nucleoside kinase (ribokinase family)